MLPRLIFAALVFGSLATRPGAAPGRHRGPQEARPAQAHATVGPAPARSARP